MSALLSLIAVLILIILATLGVGVLHLNGLFGIVIPYIAVTMFIIGFFYRIFKWASAPVPFRITTTCGQEKSLSWIKRNRLESPFTNLEVVGRMVLEIFCFWSLFRNTKSELKEGPILVYGSNKYLWAGALAFHYSFLVIFLSFAGVK